MQPDATRNALFARLLLLAAATSLVCAGITEVGGTGAAPHFTVGGVQLIEGPDVGQYSQVKVPSDGLPVVTYFDDTNGRLRVAKCLDDACSKATLITLDGSKSGVRAGRFSKLTLDSNSLPVVSYNYDNTVKVAFCGDQACSNVTTAVVDKHTSGGYTSITVHNQLPVVAYYVNGGLRVAVCLDAGCQNVKVSTLDSKCGKYPSVAVGKDGFPSVSYQCGATLKFAHCTDAQCSAAETVVLDSSSADVGSYTSMKIGTDGFPIIMYVDEVSGHQKVAHCQTPTCAATTPAGKAVPAVDISIVDFIGVSAYGEFPEIDINPVTGFATLSYFNQKSHTAGALKVAQCLDTACTKSVPQTVAEHTCGYGRDSSIGFGPGGLVYISFLDYNQDGRAKYCRVALLNQESSTPARRSFRSRGATDDFGAHIDICKG